MDNETRAPILAFVRAFNMSVPVQQGSGQVFHAEGRYFSWRCEMRALPSGYFGLVVAVTRITFEPKWSNPLWDLLEVVAYSEAGRILAAVGSVEQRMEALEPTDLEVSDATIKADNLPVVSSKAGVGGTVACFLALILLVLGALLAFFCIGRRGEAGTAFFRIDADDGDPSREGDNSRWIAVGGGELLPGSRSASPTAASDTSRLSTGTNGEPS